MSAQGLTVGGLVTLLLLSVLSTAGVQAAGDDVGAFSQTKTVQRVFVEGGQDRVVDERTVTVDVDHTKNLRGRERVAISWSGARPSAARSTNPFGERGLDQEYPMVILQCRGRDDASLPRARQVRPETCFTSTPQQRSRRAVPDDAAVWRADSQATERDRGALSGVDSLPKGCGSRTEGFSDRITRFEGVKTAFASCTSDTMAPEAAVDASFPPAEQAAFTDLAGNGQTQFEVRSAIENESLGCDDATACSIVVIPIMGLGCDQTDSRTLNAACRADGRFEPGSSNFDGQGVDDAVSSKYWWSASNWQNRITVPITFGPAPNVCSVLDSRAPVGFYGSELMSQATLQWAPAYCLRRDRFRFQHNVLPDIASYNLMQSDEVPAAFVSSDKSKEGQGTAPVGYAPTAVTGFAISYIVDRPDNAGEYTDLRLNARLLAKLLTQSYPGSEPGRGHPGLGKNPLSINQDPEFVALNPGLDERDREAAAVLLNLSESSDVVTSMTSYIADDPEAAAFVEGEPDPWGMAINPRYRGIEVPRDEWPLRDDYKPTTEQKCLLANNDVAYLSRLAAPVTSFAKISEALLDAWPYTQTKCTGDGSPQFPYVLGRSDRQGVGSRFMLGVTTLGDTERLGLRAAALQTTSVEPTKTFSASGRTFVRPDQASMAAAVSGALPKGRGKTFTLLQDGKRGSAKAYPGTLVVYTVAKTQGLDRGTARTVAGFIRTALTEGQRPGSGNGFLPDGYLPIRSSGATAPLYRAAMQVADDIAAQRSPEDGSGPGGGPAAPGDTAITDGAAAPVDASVPTDDAAAGGDAPVDDELQSLGATPALSSRLAALLLPLLLVLGIAAGVAAPVVRLLAARRSLR